MPRCGTVALAGPPNVGKSTLLNALVGEHLAIVSPKPQSTRLPVIGLLTRDDAQFIFTDSPGLLEPEYQLHEVMRAAAVRAIVDAEVVAYLHPLADFPAPPFEQVARRRCIFGPWSTSSATAKRASSSARAAARSRRSARPRAARSKRCWTSGCSSSCASKCCPSGVATRLRSSVWDTPDESRARPPRDSRLPEMQGTARAPHGARGSARVPRLPPHLRRRRRHPDHADR